MKRKTRKSLQLLGDRYIISRNNEGQFLSDKAGYRQAKKLYNQLDHISRGNFNKLVFKFDQ